ncbi:hypothetical protein CCP3SC1_1910003 [Gammaproteobacteria bacterium]
MARKQVQPTATLREIDATTIARILGYAPSRGGELLTERLIVAPIEINNEISSIELIDETGRKVSIKDGAVAGGYWTTQSLSTTDCAPTVLSIGEGIATVLSVQQATNHQVVAARYCKNLVTVAKSMRARYPNTRIIILSDIGNGQADAERAAQAVNGILALPRFTVKEVESFTVQYGKPPTDFNDLAVLNGLDEVRVQIDATINLFVDAIRETGGRTDSRTGETLHKQLGDNLTGDVSITGKEISRNLMIQALPIIEIRGGTLPKQVEEAERALIAAGVEIYQRSGDLVRPVKITNEINEDGIIIPAGSVVLGNVDKSWLIKRFTMVADFQKYIRREDRFTSVDCPPMVAEVYLADVGDWSIPPVIGISGCPTIRKNGTLILDSGYDRKSGIYVDYQGPQVIVKDNPTQEDALEALELLKKPLAEFPFVNEESRSVILSGMLTGTSRRILRSSPLHAASAPKKGSGKGLLAYIISAIVTGRGPMMLSQGRDEAEDEKRLSSALMRSASVICIDNIEREVYGDFLCTMLTEQEVSPRILGMSKLIDLPTNTTVLATGNNLTFKGDMTRRVLHCRIDPECERPDALEFSLNLREWIPANRHLLIGAALTILRAYHVAGRPKQPIKPYGSFEEWSNLVRSALVWLGVADPCLTRESVEQHDPVTESLSAVLTLWHRAFGNDIKTTAEVIEDCNLAVHADLKHALLEVAMSSRNSDVIDPKRLGRWLKQYEKRVESGLRIERTGEDTHVKVTYWKVTSTPITLRGLRVTAGNVSVDAWNFGSGGVLLGNSSTNNEIMDMPKTRGRAETLPAVTRKPRRVIDISIDNELIYNENGSKTTQLSTGINELTEFKCGTCAWFQQNPTEKFVGNCDAGKEKPNNAWFLFEEDARLCDRYQATITPEGRSLPPGAA